MKTRHVSNVRKNQKRNVAANHRLIRRIKRRGCWLCRKTPPNLGELHFHHLAPLHKKRGIAAMMDYSMAALVLEVRKCTLLCRTCHQAHHRAQHTALISVQGGAS